MVGRRRKAGSRFQILTISHPKVKKEMEAEEEKISKDFISNIFRFLFIRFFRCKW